jgi:hypothetical protein
MNTFKMKISRSLLEKLDEFITLLLQLETANNDEKLLVATIAQVGAIIHKKMGRYEQIKQNYSLTLNTAQMIAFVILDKDYNADLTTHLGNKIHQLANQIQQKLA